MHKQKTAPMADMLIRYWILPYHVKSSKSAEGDGGGVERGAIRKKSAQIRVN